MTWIDAMLRHGVTAWVTADRFAAHAGGRDYGPVPLVLWRRYARPADLDRLPGGDGLVVVERATRTVLSRLDAGSQAWATLDGRYSLPALGRRRDESRSPDPIAAGRPPSARDELALLVHAIPGATHAWYASALGLTRARVTQMLPGLTDGTLRHPPQPTAGHVARWWSDRDPWDQVRAAYDWLDANGCHPALGGETAADVLAPWRAPRSTVVHVRKVVPPPAGFVPADSPATATVAVVVDYRPSVLAAASSVDTPAGRLRVAHPMHVGADLVAAGTAGERGSEQTDLLLRRTRHLLESHDERPSRAPDDHVEVGFDR